MEVASLILAATTVVIYFIARRFLPVNRAVLLALLYGLASPAYFVGGRGLWQHTPSMLLLAIVIYMLLRAEERPVLAAWAGLPVALSYTCRPTDALFVIVFTAYVAVRHRRYLIWYLLAAAPVAAAFVAYNLSVYHYIFSPYYRSSLDGFSPRYWPKLAVGLAGNLVSPSRGLFVYVPVFLFSVWSMIRQKWSTPLSPWLAAIVPIHWICVSAYIWNWWAGMSYGPRFFTDLTPIFVLFLIPYFADWSALARATRTLFIAPRIDRPRHEPARRMVLFRLSLECRSEKCRPASRTQLGLVRPAVPSMARQRDAALSRASSEISISSRNTTAEPASGSPITTRTPHTDAKYPSVHGASIPPAMAKEKIPL